MKALKELLKEKYGDYSVKDAIKEYAPVSDSNNPDQYVDFLKRNGIEVDKKVKEQTDKLSEWTKQFEGWIKGTVKPKDCGCKK
jgi:hypothetical protein